MKNFLASDIHLEFGRGQFIVPEGDYLFLAGDIFVPWYNNKVKDHWKQKDFEKKCKKFFKQCSDNFKQVILIAGNHEYYYGDFLETDEKIISYIDDFKNIKYLNNTGYDLDEENIIFGATFWTDINNAQDDLMHTIDLELNDFKEITLNKNYFSTFNYVDANKKSRVALFDFLEKNQDKNVYILTHHAPSELSLSLKEQLSYEKYCYFNTNLAEKLKSYKNIKAWMHGHIHNKCNYIMNDGILVLNNPRGYFNHEKNAKHFAFEDISNVFDFNKNQTNEKKIKLTNNF